MKRTTTLATALAALAALIGGSAPSQAQLLYFQDFDTDQNASGNWVTNALGNSPADLYFDYSTVGIPSAPNSVGGTTRGVKLNANLGPGIFPSGVSVSPLDFSLDVDSNFVIHCDVWLNYNGPLPAGGSGSTQLGGIGYGTAGLAPQIIGIADSFFAITAGDGGVATDYRVYTAAFPGSMQLASGVYVAGSQNNTDSYYATNFPSVTAPAAQLALYPGQTGSTQAGVQGFRWADAKIEKIGPFVTWSLDNLPIAVVDIRTNGPFAGDKLLLTFSDINSGASADPLAPELAFALFDNLRVSNVVANVVTINATQPNASETGPTPAVFTFSRTITGSAQTVNYTIGGTAENGVDYTNALGGPLTGTISFGASASSVDLVVVPIDDNISEPTETIIITVADGSGYIGAGSATAFIEDNDTPLLFVTADAATMFERHTNDYASVIVTRWGDPNAFLSVDTDNFTFAGNAVLNTDYVINSNNFPIFIFPGDVQVTNRIVSPIDNNIYTGNKTITIGMVPGVGFTVAPSNAVITIIDDENPPATVLYSNPLTDAADAVNWKIAFENGNLLSFGPDFEASFGYDLTTGPSGGGVVAPPPSGATTALRATVNKLVARNAGLNLYLTNISFSGDFAVRFNMNVIIDTAPGTTQGPLFGINHNGMQTNWWAGSGSVPEGGPWAMDGLWYWISADGGAAAGDYILHTGAGGALPNAGFNRLAIGIDTSFVRQFKAPDGPYTFAPGLVGNLPSSIGGIEATANWTDVEIKYERDVITLYMNKTQVLRTTNTTTFKDGFLMLGYSDPFSSIGDPSGAVYYSNLRVVELTPPVITSINRSGSAVTLAFTSPDGTTSGYVLEGASTVNGVYAPVAGASITQLPDGSFLATATSTADEQYFRIRKL